MFFLEI
jgi:hypothetical protein